MYTCLWKKWKRALWSSLAAHLLLAATGSPAFAQSGAELPNTGMADPATFSHLYAQWRAGQSGDGSALTLSLVAINGISRDPSNGVGQVRIDTRTGAVSSRVAGLPAGEWDLWLIDNQPGAGHSTLADPADRMLLAGRYRAADGGGLALDTVLPEERAGFQFDRAMVVRGGQTPAAGFALTGAATIYDRLFRGYVRAGGSDSSQGQIVQGDTALWDLIARGRRIFRGERFQGNGRACGTCHAESNNFTIDPAFVSTLPESDPLFVHERAADLARNFEDAGLLRSHGLILANADGLDNLREKFTLRSVPFLQAIGTQSRAPEPGFFIDFTGGPLSPPERVGWSNDNLPLREFAIGAILQHMPRTLARRPGTDFRVPTDEELDALAVYQLSLGRQEDFDLGKLRVRPVEAQQGQRLYTDTGNIGEPGRKNCNACHFNGGGTAAFAFNPDAPGFSPKLDANPRGFNATSGTNVNGLPASAMLRAPRDGGFGVARLPLGSFGNFGLLPDTPPLPVEEFNSISVIESADTAPYFHNHAVATLEEAIAFYGTPAYQEPISIGDKVAGPIPVRISSDPRDPEVRAIATFLRVLNGLENVRSAVSAVERARRAASVDDARELAALAREEVIDAIEALSSGSLGVTSDLSILLCRTRLSIARTQLDVARNTEARAGIGAPLQAAATALRAARDILAVTDTLPPSYQR